MGYVYITNTTLTKGVVKLNDAGTPPIRWQQITNPSSSTYHYECWVYVKSFPNAGDEKALFYRGDSGSESKFALTLTGDKKLRVCVGDVVTTGTVAHSDPNAYITITEEFPLQKWVYIVVNVVNNSIIEAYLNGKLVKTLQLTPAKIAAFTPNARSSITIGGATSVDGYLTKFKRDPSALSPDDIWNNYLAGNGLATFTNWLAGYNASFSVFTTAGEVKKYTLL